MRYDLLDRREDNKNQKLILIQIYIFKQPLCLIKEFVMIYFPYGLWTRPFHSTSADLTTHTELAPHLTPWHKLTWHKHHSWTQSWLNYLNPSSIRKPLFSSFPSFSPGFKVFWSFSSSPRLSCCLSVSRISHNLNNMWRTEQPVETLRGRFQRRELNI